MNRNCKVHNLAEEALAFKPEDHYYPFGMQMPMLNYQSANTTSNKYKYNGKELQDDAFDTDGNSITDTKLDWYDYGARMYDPAIARWHVIDPRSEKYYDWSPYSYAINNPINYIDPNGMFVDEYGVDKSGNVKFLKAKEGPDELYKIDDKGKKVDVNGDGKMTENTDFVKVDNKSILPQLSKVKNKIYREDAEGDVYETGYERTAFTNENSGNDMKKIFKFAADNTSVEWGLKYAEKNNNKQYGVGTYGFNDLSPGLFNREETITGIHSHPNPLNKKDEIDSMWGDRNNSNEGYKGYVYMPKSSNMYHVKSGKSSFIRKVNNYMQFINL